MWIFLSPSARRPCVVNVIPDTLSLIHEQNVGPIFIRSLSHSQNRTRQVWPPGTPCRGGRMRKFSPPPEFSLRTDQTVATRYTDYDIRVRKFSLCLYMVFVARLQHHGVPQDAVFQFLLLLLGRNQSHSDIACSFKCSAIWVTLPLFHNSRRVIAVAETVHGMHVRIYIGCPTRYRTRHFFNNFTTNEDIATKFEADYRHIPLHFSHNERTPVQISLQYLHWC